MDKKQVKTIISLFNRTLKKIVFNDNDIDQSIKAKTIMAGLLNQYQFDENDLNIINTYVDTIIKFNKIETEFKNVLAKTKK